VEFVTTAHVGYSAQRLLEVVKMLPGVHLREAQRRTGLGLGDTVYQLQKLESMGLVDSEKHGRYRRYYPADINVVDRRILSVLLNPNRRLIITLLLAKQALNVSDLAAKLKLGKSTTMWHLKILESEGLVKSPVGLPDSTVWRLKDPGKARRILSRLNLNTLDRLSESFLQSWDLVGRD
jgi:predicted transcriptional regulator